MSRVRVKPLVTGINARYLSVTEALRDNESLLMDREERFSLFESKYLDTAEDSYPALFGPPSTTLAQH